MKNLVIFLDPQFYCPQTLVTMTFHFVLHCANWFGSAINISLCRWYLFVLWIALSWPYHALALVLLNIKCASVRVMQNQLIFTTTFRPSPSRKTVAVVLMTSILSIRRQREREKDRVFACHLLQQNNCSRVGDKNLDELWLAHIKVKS